MKGPKSGYSRSIVAAQSRPLPGLMSGDGLVTADSVPDSDAILARDIAFHLGEQAAYQVGSIEEICRAHPPPDNGFLCLSVGERGIIAGAAYENNCTVVSDGVRIREGARLTRKQRRTIETINRDRAFMHPAIPYAFDLRDARDHDYAAVYGTSKPIPVFQYHRRRGLSAIIHPLPRYHEYPSSKLRVIEDSKTFAEKRAKIFWRGNLTAWIRTPKQQMTVPRLLTAEDIGIDEKMILLEQSLRFVVCKANVDSDYIDAGLVVPWGERGYPSDFPPLQPLCKDRVGIEEHLKYRYLLALDGYDGASAWYWMLNTNSLVMRQESRWEMYGDCYFEPWKHFVPIAGDGSDLTEKFEWCEQNRAQCERMVKNAKRAWAVLFDRDYQVARRRAVFEAYNQWFE